MSVYTHELCEVCDAPKWIMANDEHRCMTIEQLHQRYAMDTEAFDHLQKYIHNLERDLDKIKTENTILNQLLDEQMQGQKNFGQS